MTGVVRLGDTSSHGGHMVSASAGFRVNNIIACVDGDSHSCPIPGHGTTAIISTGIVRSGGRSVSRIGDHTGCGAVLTSGSTDTRIDDNGT